MRYTFIFIVFFAFSCGSSDDGERITNTIFDTAELNISTISEGSNITFHIEVLNDTVNDLATPFPLTDNCSIAFDVDNNNEIDSSVDFIVGLTNDKLPCESFIIDEMTLSPCFSSTGFVVNSSFASSALLSDEHVIWDFSVSKSRFSADNTVQFRVKIQNPNDLISYPNYKPTQEPGFTYLDQTFTASW